MKIEKKVLWFLILLVFFSGAIAIVMGIAPPGSELEKPPNVKPEGTTVLDHPTPVSTPPPADTEGAGLAMPTPTTRDNEFWIEVEEPLGGVRFAVPCSWEVELPEDHARLGTFAYCLRNYPLDYSRRLAPQENVFDRGGIKIDLVYMRALARGADVLERMQAYVETMHMEDETGRVVATEPQVINGQLSLQVTTESAHGVSRFHLFKVNDDFFLIFAPNPQAIDHPDVQGVLHSLAVEEGVQVSRPAFKPGYPPEGLAAPCLGLTIPSPDPPPNPEDCAKNSFPYADELILGIQQAIHLRKFGNLVYDYMPDSFYLGTWPSETTALLPYQAGNELRFSLLPEDTTALAFNVDPADLPDLDGMSLEPTLGPGEIIAHVVHSEGWEPGGAGGALLFIVQDACGQHYWHSLVYSPDNFDPAPLSGTNRGASLKVPTRPPDGEAVELSFTLTNPSESPGYFLDGSLPLSSSLRSRR